MDKIINFFGDSHIYGNGLDDCGLVEPWKQHSTKTWPYHMFPKEQIANYSYPGCSNDMMALRLIRHTKKENIVVIMFTYHGRMHYIKNGYNLLISPKSCYAISESGNENWIGKQIADKHREEYKRFVVNNFDKDFWEIQFLKNVLMCQYFCESNQIEYYFTMGINKEKTQMDQSLEKYRDSLYQSINWSNVFLVDNKYGFTDYGKKINAERNSDGFHFGEQYHKLFGKLFLDWINAKKKV